MEWISYLFACVCFCLQKATPDMHQFLSELKQRVRVGVVGGSDLDKIKEQLGDDGVYNKYFKYKCKYISKNFVHLQCACFLRSKSNVSCFTVIDRVDYVFAENGLVAYRFGKMHSVQVVLILCLLFNKLTNSLTYCPANDTSGFSIVIFFFSF